MKMQTGGLIAETVLDVDYHSIADSRSDMRQRPLTVDAYDRPCHGAIRVRRHPPDFEIISPRVSTCDGSKGNQAANSGLAQTGNHLAFHD